MAGCVCIRSGVCGVACDVCDRVCVAYLHKANNIYVCADIIIKAESSVVI